MSRSFADWNVDPVSIIPAAGECTPRPKCCEIEIQTGDELTPKYVDAESSSVDRKDAQIQTKVEIYKPPQVDESKLLAFLKRVEPIAMRELQPTSAYQYLEKKIATGTIEISATHETDSNYTVSALSVNCTGSTVAVALKHSNHFGFCKHSSQLHFISTVSSATSHQIALDSCATSVSYHPHYPAIVAVGHHTGEVSIIRNEEKWAHTPLGETHVDEIVSVDWLSDRQKVLALVSASAGGLICVWNLKGRNARTKILEQNQQTTVSDRDGSISCLRVIPGTSDALVGMESGMIVRVALPFENNIMREKQYFSGHTGPVTAISMCPIAPGLFVSVGTDESMCVRNGVVSNPLNVEQLLNSPLYDVCWSKNCPSMVAIVAADRVVVVDFCVSSSTPIQTFEVPNATRVAWNDYNPGTLIIGCSDGRVIVYSCNGVFEQKPGANRLLSQWEAQTKIVLSRE